MPQIVKPGFRRTDPGHNTLEAIVYRAVTDIVAQIVCEYEVCFCPKRACTQTLFGLPVFLLQQQIHDGSGGGDCPGLAVFSDWSA